eukprot:CAMPEP_0170072234 /NCGR_PEP_ID=MMETSP0019_2-20121128/9929_1 /TAXON_ID=98059 /ORGANISM="Dinobryon sp., Strain UTEXLB2267" /LENGTH=639 /DNA_ID=CAMNT_0010281115 /DNA_START=293 /DNA_END=2212 /DNA_ORIENTATION=+
MQMCMICLDNKQVFPSEQRVYNQKEYETHLKSGDGDGSKGHPNCEFCKKRYYDSNGLFFHLTKDHFTCHICEKLEATNRYKYYGQYKDLELHFRRGHFLCEERSCLEERYIVFSNEIELAAHNRKLHPYLNTNRVVNVHFPSRRELQAVSSGKYDGDSLAESTSSSSHPATSTKYEGGLGGRATAEGEWVVEIHPAAIARDPRDPNRNNNIRFTDSSSSSTSSASTALAYTAVTLNEEAEFPALSGGTAASTALTSNKWITFGGSSGDVTAAAKQKKKAAADFPPLQSEEFHQKVGIAVSSSSSSSLKLKSNNRSASSGNLANSIEQEYLKSARASDKAMKSRWLGAEIVTKIPAAKTSSEEDSALAWAISESLKDVSNKKTKATTLATEPKKAAVVDDDQWISPPVKIDTSSEVAYPSLQSSENEFISSKQSSTSSKKKAAATGGVSGWSSALSSVGLATTTKKGPSLKVIKAPSRATDADSIGIRLPPSDDDLLMNLLPIGKHSRQLLDAGGRSNSVPPPAGSVAPASWVKVGGAPSHSAETSQKVSNYSNNFMEDDEEEWIEQEAVPVKAPPVALDLADFPSLSSKATNSSSNSSSSKSVAAVLKPKKAPRKERVEDLLRKIETSSLASSVKKNKV